MNRIKGVSHAIRIICLGLVLNGLLLSNVHAKHIGLFYHHEFVDIEQESIFSEASNLKASLEHLGHQVTVFGHIEVLDMSDIDLIIVPELEKQSLVSARTAAQLNIYKEYVDNGGGIIVMGVVSSSSDNNKNGIELINYLSGYQLQSGTAILEGTCVKNTNIPFNDFASAPDKINNNNAVVYITSGFPEGGKVIYSNEMRPAEIAVAQFPKGNGSVMYFGWGWWNAFPTGSQDGGWLDLLESSINTLTCASPSIHVDDSYTFELNESGFFELDPNFFRQNAFACTDAVIELSQTLFTCEHIDEPIVVEVVVMDELERTASTMISILITDANATCSVQALGYKFLGTVTNALGKPLSSVEVVLEAELPEYMISNDEGNFESVDFINGNYQLHLSKTDTRAREVSSYDLRILQRHILGLELFTSPYQYLAADMNGDKIIDLADLMIVKKLLLHTEITEQLSSNWHWISSDFLFDGIDRPLNQNWDTLQESKVGEQNNILQIIGIKSGDVDFSY